MFDLAHIIFWNSWANGLNGKTYINIPAFQLKKISKNKKPLGLETRCPNSFMKQSDGTKSSFALIPGRHSHEIFAPMPFYQVHDPHLRYLLSPWVEPHVYRENICTGCEEPWSLCGGPRKQNVICNKLQKRRGTGSCNKTEVSYLIPFGTLVFWRSILWWLLIDYSQNILAGLVNIVYSLKYC